MWACHSHIRHKLLKNELYLHLCILAEEMAYRRCSINVLNSRIIYQLMKGKNVYEKVSDLPKVKGAAIVSVLEYISV